MHAPLARWRWHGRHLDKCLVSKELSRFSSLLEIAKRPVTELTIRQKDSSCAASPGVEWVSTFPELDQSRASRKAAGSTAVGIDASERRG